MFQEEKRFIVIISVLIGIGVASLTHFYIPSSTLRGNACPQVSEQTDCSDDLYNLTQTKYGFPYMSRVTQKGGELINLPAEIESLPNFLFNVGFWALVAGSILLWPRKKQTKRHRKQLRQKRSRHAHSRH